VGEEGVDAGGVTREWYMVLSREVFNPNYVLFQSSLNGQMFQPSPKSSVNTDHLKYFKFIGRFVGKALYDGFLLDCFFTRSFYKHILG
jgi:E3 ubiquitin-protein ligase HUWE1